MCLDVFPSIYDFLLVLRELAEKPSKWNLWGYVGRCSQLGSLQALEPFVDEVSREGLWKRITTNKAQCRRSLRNVWYDETAAVLKMFAKCNKANPLLFRNISICDSCLVVDLPTLSHLTEVVRISSAHI